MNTLKVLLGEIPEGHADQHTVNGMIAGRGVDAQHSKPVARSESLTNVGKLAVLEDDEV